MKPSTPPLKTPITRSRRRSGVTFSTSSRKARKSVLETLLRNLRRHKTTRTKVDSWLAKIRKPTILSSFLARKSHSLLFTTILLVLASSILADSEKIFGVNLSSSTKVRKNKQSIRNSWTRNCKGIQNFKIWFKVFIHSIVAMKALTSKYKWCRPILVSTLSCRSPEVPFQVKKQWRSNFKTFLGQTLSSSI